MSIQNIYPERVGHGLERDERYVWDWNATLFRVDSIRFFPGVGRKERGQPRALLPSRFAAVSPVHGTGPLPES